VVCHALVHASWVAVLGAGTLCAVQTLACPAVHVRLVPWPIMLLNCMAASCAAFVTCIMTRMMYMCTTYVPVLVYVPVLLIAYMCRIDRTGPWCPGPDQVTKLIIGRYHRVYSTVQPAGSTYQTCSAGFTFLANARTSMDCVPECSSPAAYSTALDTAAGSSLLPVAMFSACSPNHTAANWRQGQPDELTLTRKLLLHHCSPQ
jgi:hypothetical protein